jgi:Protein of unknown function (DUF3617)
MFRNFVIVTLAALSTPAAAQQLEAGEWQFDTAMTSPMMPKPQSSTFTRCVKKEEASDPSKWGGKPQAQTDCVVTPGAKSPDSYSWEISCPKSGMKGKGSARFGRGTVETEMHMTGEMQGRAFDILTKTSGKRLGPCKS